MGTSPWEWEDNGTHFVPKPHRAFYRLYPNYYQVNVVTVIVLFPDPIPLARNGVWERDYYSKGIHTTLEV